MRLDWLQGPAVVSEDWRVFQSDVCLLIIFC